MEAERHEELIKRMADLVAQLQTGHADDTPEVLKKNPAMRAMFKICARTATPARRPGSIEFSFRVTVR